MTLRIAPALTPQVAPALVFALASVLSGCGSDDSTLQHEELPTDTDPSPLEERALEIINAHLEDGDYLGASAALLDREGNMSQVSAGRVGLDVGSASVDPQTPWMIGSVTKTFVSVVVCQLIEEGRLVLDDNIQAFFPELPGASQITVRNLLQHTSGLHEYINTDAISEEAQRAWTPEELTQVAVARGPAGAIGGPFSYSNTNFLLLGSIVEQLTGNTWYTEVVSRITEPLGMDNTYYPEMPNSRASGLGHRFAEEGLIESTDRLHYSVGGAAGGMLSIAEDLLVFATALYSGALLTEENQLEMTRFIPAEDYGYIDYQYGLGFMKYQVNNLTMHGHLGSSDSHASYIGFDPESGAAIALQVNVDNPAATAFTAAELLGALTNLDVSPPQE